MRKDVALNDLTAMIENLSLRDKKALADRIMDMMRNACGEGDSLSLTCNNMVREHIESEKPNCPHCHAKSNLGCIVKHGFKNGVQRFLCKSCGKKFVATTNTVFERTRKSSDIWYKFIELTISGASLKKCSEECGLAYQTAFTWRHKILNAFRINQADTNMSGRIEMDEMLVSISYKGNHVQGEKFTERRLNKDGSNNNMPRKSYRRGSDNNSSSSKEMACVFCMVKDGNKGYYATVPGLGYMLAPMLEKTVGKHVNKEDSIILVDQYCATAKYLRENNYNYQTLASNTSKKYYAHKPEIRDGLHIQHVNAMHMNIRRFLRPYCGVSTKYLENYLSLYVWLMNVAARRQRKHAQQVSVTRLSESDCYITRKDLEAFPATPVCA